MKALEGEGWHYLKQSLAIKKQILLLHTKLRKLTILAAKIKAHKKKVNWEKVIQKFQDFERGEKKLEADQKKLQNTLQKLLEAPQSERLVQAKSSKRKQPSTKKKPEKEEKVEKTGKEDKVSKPLKEKKPKKEAAPNPSKKKSTKSQKTPKTALTTNQNGTNKIQNFFVKATNSEKKKDENEKFRFWDSMGKFSIKPQFKDLDLFLSTPEMMDFQQFFSEKKKQG